jgi:hypothetical protein
MGREEAFAIRQEEVDKLPTLIVNLSFDLGGRVLYLKKEFKAKVEPTSHFGITKGRR